MLWKAPMYSGSSPVSGYFVDYREEDSGEWITINEAPTANRYLKVTTLLRFCFLWEDIALVPWQTSLTPPVDLPRHVGTTAVAAKGASEQAPTSAGPPLTGSCRAGCGDV